MATTLQGGAAGPPVAWGDLSAQRILGKRNPRPEGPAKVTGKAQYSSDVILPGMLYGRYLMAPAPGKITAIDVSGAERLSGVKAVIVIANAGADITFHGQPVAAIAATTPEIAEDAARAIRVTYEKKPFVVDLHKAMAAGSPPVQANQTSNVAFPGKNTSGDPAGAMAGAAATVEATYLAQTRLHCCLETHGSTVKWDGDKLTVWASTQYTDGVKNELAQLAGGPQNVRVITDHMGGGFGSKFQAELHGRMAAQLAKQANAPVKFMLTRAEEQLANYRGPGVLAEVKLGASGDGTLVAAVVKTYNDGGFRNAGTPLDAGNYIIPAQNTDAQRNAVLTNTADTAALRAPGHPQAALIWDQALDLLAAKLDMDPLELRKKNHSDPVRVAEWDLGAKIIGWNRRQKPGSARGVRKRGMGMGSATWGGGGGKSADCTVLIGKDGSVQSLSGVQDLGTGQRTYVAAIVAEELGLELKDVTPKIGDTNYGPGHASGGSTTTAAVAPAVKMAAVDAKAKVLAAAAKALQSTPGNVELLVGGKVQVKGNPAKSLTWKQLCATLPADGIKAHGEHNPNLQASGVRGCTFAEVEVDTGTGRIEILKVVGIQDCGFVLNRLQGENQITGSIIQGIGTALLEERRMDNLTGRMLNPNFEDYKLCGAFEAGGINITLDPPYRTLGADERGIATVCYDNPTGKVSGLGEPAIIGVHAAIANAIFNAIGVQVTHSPATPDKVLAALGKKGVTA